MSDSQHQNGHPVTNGLLSGAGISHDGLDSSQFLHSLTGKQAIQHDEGHHQAAIHLANATTGEQQDDDMAGSLMTLVDRSDEPGQEEQVRPEVQYENTEQTAAQVNWEHHQSDDVNYDEAAEHYPEVDAQTDGQQEGEGQGQLDGVGEHVGETDAQQEGNEDAYNAEGNADRGAPHDGAASLSYLGESSIYPSSAADALSAAAAAAAATQESSFVPYPQHPHLGAEVLEPAAAVTQHVDQASAPAEESNGGEHLSAEDAEGAINDEAETYANDDLGDEDESQQDPSSGRAPRQMHAMFEHGKNNTPYSRTPDMRNSHKLAERRRRKEMRELFDELRAFLPVDNGPKTSKWEVLSKTIEYVGALQQDRDALFNEVQTHRINAGQPPLVDSVMQHDGHVESGQHGEETEEEYAEEQQARELEHDAAADGTALEYDGEQYADQGHEGEAGHGEHVQQAEEEQQQQYAPQDAYGENGKGGQPVVDAEDGREVQEADKTPLDEWAAALAA